APRSRTRPRPSRMLNRLISCSPPINTDPSVRTPSTSHRNNRTRFSAVSRAADPERPRADLRPWALELRFSASVRGILLNSGIHLQQAFEQYGHFGQWDHVRPVTQGPVRVWVRLEADPIGARRQRASGEHGRELALAARAVAGTARKLDGVSRVEDHRKAKPAHDRD